MAEKEQNLNFEEAMEQLENIANELEKGDLDLDTSVSKFEEGMKLSKQCNKFLENAEKRITILLKNGDKIEEENFIQEEE
jgi:exodeoxyribonuclease VII small subunit